MKSACTFPSWRCVDKYKFVSNPAGHELLIQALPTQNSSKGRKKIGFYSYFLIEKSSEKTGKYKFVDIFWIQTILCKLWVVHSFGNRIFLP
jgi:hypothetical protein